MNIYLGNPPNTNVDCYIDVDDKDTKHQESALDFLKTTTNCSLASWPTGTFKSKPLTTKTPLFVVTDEHNCMLFDEDQVPYRILKNPNTNKSKKLASAQVGSQNCVFWLGHISKDKNGIYKWANAASRKIRSYFSVFPSGLCEQIAFRTGEHNEYNHYFIIEPISGIVIDTKAESQEAKIIKEFFESTN
jgi:hypothetical protein